MSIVENNEAYQNNHKAFREGISPKESINYYTEWSKTGGYEKDLSKGGTYHGPIVSGEVICQLYPDNRENITILDIAAGTGYVGEELKKKGFNQVDALEPSEGMLEQAMSKNVYQSGICDILGGTEFHIKDDAYDCTVVCGGMGEGHIPCSGLNEMIRVVKPGGVVCIVMREEYLVDVKEYKDKLEPYMEELEKAGKWKKIDRIVFPNHFMGKAGVIFLYRVQTGGS